MTATNASDAFPPGDPRVGIDVEAKDTLGYISKISITWQAGDSPEVRNYPLDDCRPNTPTQRSERLEHDYTDAGSYVAVVAVTSSDCTGENSRTRYAQVNVSTSGSSSTP